MLKISVVTIAFNCKSAIEKTILSVINQTYKNLEYIIIDGASNDGTMDIVGRYADRISYVSSEPDKGIYDAMNKGLNAATGDYIIFMNAGDAFYSLDVLEKFVPLINTDTIIAYGDVMKVAKRYKYLVRPAALENMPQFMINSHQATFTRLDYHKSHPFDLSFRSSGDYDFFYKAYVVDHVAFQYIPVVVADFDCVDGTSNANFKRSERENLRIWRKERDWVFIARQTVELNIMALKIWIKRHLLSERQSDLLEQRRLKSLGYKIINTVDTDGE